MRVGASVRSGVVLITGLVGVAIPYGLAAQGAPLDLLGLLRRDGVAVPLYRHTSRGWMTVASSRDPRRSAVGSWPRTDRYFTRDSTGAAVELRAGTAVTLHDPYDVWGQLTDLAEVNVSTFEVPVPRIGYVVTDSVGDAPFVRREWDLPSDDQLNIWFDSLGSPADPLEAVDWRRVSWEASVGDEHWVFFSATRFYRGTALPCVTVQGWRRLSEPRPVQRLLDIGRDDCEGKGSPADRRPWALVQRGDSLFAFISASGWESWHPELWRLQPDASATRVSDPCLSCR